jgi:predicted AAA+ superfamily ATPase
VKRLILEKLEKWKQSKRRKPLLLRGARQVGKTWVLKEFGNTFADGFVHIDFDKQVEYRQFFEQTKDVKRILDNLALATGKKITPKTLIIFDEIQACESALNSLKYFYEDAPQYSVVGAGSLLGLKLASGFPVGKVEFLDMYPMTFTEFLFANGNANLVEYLDSIEKVENIPIAFFNPLEEKLKTYFVTGGMPEAVLNWAEDRDIVSADKVLLDILTAYEADFAKHANKNDVPKIQYIWDSLPSQLSRENKKFLYSAVKPGARAREYENALNWLYNANLVKKVFRITKPGLPISAYDDLTSFKIYMGDVGLLRKKSGLSTSAFAEQNRLFTEFKGALCENFVLQNLSRLFDVSPRYWNDNFHEVDFIVQHENSIIPVETKASVNVKATSIKYYDKQYNAPLMIRFSMRNFSCDGKILNIPLFMADRIKQVLEMRK